MRKKNLLAHRSVGEGVIKPIVGQLLLRLSGDWCAAKRLFPLSLTLNYSPFCSQNVTSHAKMYTKGFPFSHGKLCTSCSSSVPKKFPSV